MVCFVVCGFYALALMSLQAGLSDVIFSTADFKF